MDVKVVLAGPLYVSVQRNCCHNFYLQIPPFPHRAEMASPVFCVHNTQNYSFSPNKGFDQQIGLIMGTSPEEFSPKGFSNFSRKAAGGQPLKLNRLNPRYTWVTHGLKASSSACMSVISSGCLYHGDGKGGFLIICTIMYSWKNVLIL